MKKIIISLFTLLLSLVSFSQEYQFETVIDLESSTIKSQGHTGTCWSFATSSFLESEIYRISGKQVDISEMYLVRNTYKKKAWNYVMRQGKTQFSEGGLAHDVINAVETYGLVPQSAFTDVFGNEKVYNHESLIPKIKTILDAYIKNDTDSDYPNWQDAIAPLLDKNIGKNPEHFSFEGHTFSPSIFRDFLEIYPEQYISITSFTHEKPYSQFVLNIPDNFSNGRFYNVPLDELVSITNASLKKGFSIALDVDVSEKAFSAKHGVALLPIDTKNTKAAMEEIIPEITVTAAYRQQEFENYNTTDDHLMHIIGMVKDQEGNLYYKVKNSWGGTSERVGNDGYIYMSIPYFRLKAISILLHSDALDDSMLSKLNI